MSLGFITPTYGQPFFWVCERDGNPNFKLKYLVKPDLKEVVIGFPQGGTETFLATTHTKNIWSIFNYSNGFNLEEENMHFTHSFLDFNDNTITSTVYYGSEFPDNELYDKDKFPEITRYRNVLVSRDKCERTEIN
ncbi:hypothetical protein N9368_01010 [Alphaproteobacteria bacterium]|nr:hypothetical protein [Alphaproteobacteria bacterium]